MNYIILYQLSLYTLFSDKGSIFAFCNNLLENLTEWLKSQRITRILTPLNILNNLLVLNLIKSAKSNTF